MAKQQETPQAGRDDVVRLMGEISEKSQQLLQDFAAREAADGGGSPDPLNLGSTVL